MEFTDPEHIALLTAWKAIRAEQTAVAGHPLWGRDLQEARRLYARACGLLGQSCKHVSGDAHESIYSFRHGLITDEVFKALTTDDTRKAQLALRRASVRANHGSPETTVERYFHRGPEVVALHARRAVAALLTVAAAAKWSGLSQSALEKRISRSNLPSDEVLWTAIGRSVKSGPVKHINEIHPCAPSHDKPVPARLALEDVAHSQVCLTLSFAKATPTASGEGALAGFFTDWERTLVLARSRYAMQFSDAIRPASLRQEKLVAIARALRRPVLTPDIKAATGLWRRTARQGFLDVSDPANLHGWLEFLWACGVPGWQLLVRLESSMTCKLETINAAFQLVTAIQPAIDVVPGGKGRPKAYLLISSQASKPGHSLPSASTSMVGFNALMLSACMREDLCARQPGEAGCGEHQ